MGYENIDEATRREACERVKQIVKAIKAIKIKYYLNFSRISAKDQEKYQKLETSLEKISSSHNLDKLKVALMQEVSAKYDGKDIEDMKKGEQPEPDDILQACYGATDAEKEALSRGRITQAARCQQMFQEYLKELESAHYREIINYRREKFAELMISRDQVEEKNEIWNNKMKSLCRPEHVTKRQKAWGQIQSVQNKDIEKNKEEEILSI